MSGEDFRVDVETLAESARGVRDAVGELTAMGGWGSELGASRGQGLTQALSGLDTGHDELDSALEEFADAWDFALRHRVKNGTSAAEQLEDAARRYTAMDQDAARELGQILSEGRGGHGQ